MRRVVKFVNITEAVRAISLVTLRRFIYNKHGKRINE